jgi:hypothetical protein
MARGPLSHRAFRRSLHGLSMGVLSNLRRWLVRVLAEEPVALPESAGATRTDAAPCDACEALRNELVTARASRDDERRLGEASRREHEEARRLHEDTASELERVREELVETVRRQHAAEVALAATKKHATIGASPTPSPPQVTTPSSTDALPEPKKSTPDGRGRRIAELERLLAESDDRGERYRHRAEDAERDLESRGEAHARELETIREEMTRERESLQRAVREAEKRARSATQRAVDRPESLGKTPRPGDARSGVAEVHWSPGDACYEAILRELERADRTIDVCVFTITDDRLARALLEVHRRGVRLRVLTDNDKAEDEGSDVARLERAGVPVRVDRTEYHMHHKFAVFDGRRAITGSYNWTRGAARNNEEHIVVTDDPRLVKELGRGFETLWERLAPASD